jgi:hypothetical protein
MAAVCGWPFELALPSGDRAAGAAAGGVGGMGGDVLSRLLPRALWLHWESLTWRLASWASSSGGSGRGGGPAAPAAEGGEAAEGGLEGGGDFSETALLLGLMGVLWLVMRLRRQRAVAVAEGVDAGLAQRGELRAQQMARELGVDVSAPPPPAAAAPAAANGRPRPLAAAPGQPGGAEPAGVGPATGRQLGQEEEEERRRLARLRAAAEEALER